MERPSFGEGKKWAKEHCVFRGAYKWVEIEVIRIAEEDTTLLARVLTFVFIVTLYVSLYESTECPNAIAPLEGSFNSLLSKNTPSTRAWK